MRIHDSCYVWVATYTSLVEAQTDQRDFRFYLCDPCGGIFYEYYATWGSLDTTNMRQLMDPEDCLMCIIKAKMKALAIRKGKSTSCKICKK